MVEENRKYLSDPGLMDNPEGFVEYYLSWDAYLENGRLYLVRWAEPDRDWFDGQKEIFVFDTSTLQLLEILTFTVALGERFHAFAVTDDGQTRNIYAVMETLKHQDIQIEALVP